MVGYRGELQQYERKLYETRDGQPSGWEGMHDTTDIHDGIQTAQLIETK